MTDTLFCYSCRLRHPKEKMRLYPTKRGLRWRCLSSIEGASGSPAERDAFGQRQTVINREQARLHAQYSLLLRHRDSAG